MEAFFRFCGIPCAARYQSGTNACAYLHHPKARSRDEEIIENVLETVRGLRMDKRRHHRCPDECEVKGFKIYLGELLSTNYGPEVIRILGLHKISTMKQAEMIPYKVITVLASSSPAYGMLGTLMGLIVMLGNFEDASGLASGLAIALMTTFYGLLMTQFVWQPLANKIQATANDNQLKREANWKAYYLPSKIALNCTSSTNYRP